MRRDSALIALIGAAVVIVVAVVGFLGWRIGHDRATATVTVGAGTEVTSTGGQIDPHVAAGGHDFVQFACGQCHGEQGRGEVSADVPALTDVGKTLTVSQLASIIDKGLGESANPTKPFMPVWGEVISKQQVADLVAYVRAGLPPVPGAVPIGIPTGQGEAVAGAALYERYGCINCHGPNGLGGVPNPQAPDKAVPPLSGTDFREEFNTDAKIIDFMRTGSVLGRAPIVSMPHWGGIIPEQDFADLVAYLKTLKP